MDDEWFEGDVKTRLAEKMAGEITFSDSPGETIKKWRMSFNISQSELANYLEVSPSVISDYEGGRRKSPGINTVRRVVDALLQIDIRRGGKSVRTYANILYGFNPAVVHDICEYKRPITLNELLKRLDGVEVYSTGSDRVLYGHTIVDSLRAILELSSYDFQRLYGWSTERALIFTRVTTGRSPMVAIRVTNLKPGVVVLQGIDEIDPMAIKIAEIEQVPVLATQMDIEDMIRVMRG
ncbi:MAG: helix-turn-helix domain-containing protein [Methermicoccaceae archaeon]